MAFRKACLTGSVLTWRGGLRASTGRSELLELTCGVPQGSVLGSVKFIAYTEDLHTAINKFPLLHHCFADDTQLLESVAVNDVNSARRCLECCVTDIHDWCARRRLQLNPEKNGADLVRQLRKFGPATSDGHHNPSRTGEHKTD